MPKCYAHYCPVINCRHHRIWLTSLKLCQRFSFVVIDLPISIGIIINAISFKLRQMRLLTADNVGLNPVQMVVTITKEWFVKWNESPSPSHILHMQFHTNCYKRHRHGFLIILLFLICRLDWFSCKKDKRRILLNIGIIIIAISFWLCHGG